MIERSQIQNNRIIFLDRDGTILYDKGYMYKIEDLQFIENAIDALHKFKLLGFYLVIITNQSGVGRGYFSKEEYRIFNDYFTQTLLDNDIELDGVFQCYHPPDDKCKCRKPETGMVDAYLSENNIDLNNSFTIGDKSCDILFGKNLKTSTIQIDPNLECSYICKTKGNYIVKDLLNASDIIEKYENKRS